KTRAGRRVLTVPAEILASWEAQRPIIEKLRERAGDKWREHGLIFPSRWGTARQPELLADHLDRAIRRAGLGDHLKVHALRHTAASAMFESGVDAKAIQEVLGHAQVTTTLRVYTHAYEASRTRATAAAAELIRPPVDFAAETVGPTQRPVERPPKSRPQTDHHRGQRGTGHPVRHRPGGSG
ncbi:MAG TPA: tyrosine-type recombinase/integrase, partial [Dehalococcoidia bacterium]|nr:tyrosine-type recombinase/integrase [Dehalococcoidia bacterium]